MPDKAGGRRQEAVSPEEDALPHSLSDSKSSALLNPVSGIAHPVVGTLLAFDFGTQRIGVASGNTFSASAQPLITIDEEKNALRFAAIAELIKAWQPAALVVGLPANDDGSPHALTALCRRFAQRLHGRHGLPTLLVDERYSSIAASEQLNAQGIRGRQQKSLIDQYAAQQILQAYLDAPSVCEIVNADRGYPYEKSATQ